MSKRTELQVYSRRAFTAPATLLVWRPSCWQLPAFAPERLLSMFNPAVAALTAPPVSVVQDWRASYDGSLGAMIDMSQAVPGYDAHPDMTAALAAAAALSALYEGGGVVRASPSAGALGGYAPPRAASASSMHLPQSETNRASATDARAAPQTWRILRSGARRVRQGRGARHVLRTFCRSVEQPQTCVPRTCCRSVEASKRRRNRRLVGGRCGGCEGAAACVLPRDCAP